jgi:hypothetical protein
MIFIKNTFFSYFMTQSILPSKINFVNVSTIRKFINTENTVEGESTQVSIEYFKIQRDALVSLVGKLNSLIEDQLLLIKTQVPKKSKGDQKGHPRNKTILTSYIESIELPIPRNKED